MGYETLKDFIKVEKNQVGTGKSRFNDTAEVYYKQVYREPPIPPKKLLPILRKYDPTFQVTEADTANAQLRQKRAQKARDIIRHMEVSRHETLEKLEFKSRYRFDQHFLLFSASLEAADKNAKWVKLFDSGAPKEIADTIYRHMTETVRPMVEKALTMDEDELLDNINELNSPFSLVTEMTRILATFPFSEEQKKELTPLVSLQNAVSSLRRRVDVMASPYYESLPLERLYIKLDDWNAFTKEMTALSAKYDKFPANEDIFLHGPVDAMADDVKANSMWIAPYIQDRISYSLHKAGGDERMIYGMNGAPLDSNGIASALVQKEPLFVVIPEKGMVPCSPSLTELADPFIPGDEQVAPAMARRTRQLLQQLKDASPRWMTTGSKEFHAMEKAMSSFADTVEGLTFPPNPEQADQLRKAAQTLRETSETYQNFKLQQRMSSLDPKDPKAADKLFDRRGNLLGKNQRETARLQAARALTDLTLRADFLLTCADPQAAAQAARSELAKQDAEKAKKEEARRLENESIKRRAQEARLKDQVPEGERCTTAPEQLQEKVTYYKNLPKPDPLYTDDPLPKLHSSLPDDMNSLCKISNANRNIKDTRRAFTLLALGRLATYHLVMNERTLNKNPATGKPDGPGPIEKALLFSNKCPLATDPDFAAILEPLTPARLEEIILHDGAKTLGQKYLDRLAMKKEKATEAEKLPVKDSKKELGGAEKKSSVREHA